MYLVNSSFINKAFTRDTIIYLIAVGFFSILSQVVILRELNVTFFGIELIYILSFAFWLIGTAIGASIGGRFYIPKEKSILNLFLSVAFLLIIDVVFVRGMRILFGGVRGGYLPFLTQIIALAIALLPIGLLVGLLFQFTAKRFVEENETLAKAYAIESAGGVVGGLSSTLFLNFGISNFSIALICSFCLTFIVMYYSFNAKPSVMKYLSIAASAGILILFGFSHQIDMMITSWNNPYIIESVDTPYNRVTIASLENQISVFEDDVLSYETQTIAAEEFVQLSTLQTTNYNRVLILGGGYAGIISELLKLPVREIDYIEINKDLIEVLQKHLPSDLKNSLADKRVNLIYNDPRKFLKQKHSYSVILVGMPEPMSAQNNRFYTREFFEQCFEGMTEEGVIAFKIQSSENIWTQQLTERNTAIFNALKSTFKSVLVLPGVTNIFIASKSEVITDTKLLISRLNERNLKNKVVTPQYVNYIFTNDRFAEVQHLLSSRAQNINSDLYPICYSYTISIWLSKFFPNLLNSENPLLKIRNLKNSLLVYIILILLIGIVIVNRKFIGIKRCSLVFAAGFIGMTLEIIIILLYQNSNGILYRDIGLLLMAFMVGLSIGSFFVDRCFLIFKNGNFGIKFFGIFMLIGFALLHLIVYLLIKVDLISSLPVASVALLTDGLFVSGIFAFVSLNQVENQRLVISQLYAADLVGGCIGTLITSLILIPAYGFYVSLTLMIILSLGCLIFVW
jgi:spermidine synthase